MTEQDEGKEAAQQLYNYAAELRKQGKSKAEVEKTLIDGGMDEASARILTNNLDNQYLAAKRAKGKKNMIYGTLWCVGGAIITVVSFSSSSGGGRYFITWGAIVFGAIQFILGLTQSMSK